MKRPLTASMLYNLVQCPHRLALDIHGDPADRDEVSRFVKLLWEKGNLFEKETMEKIALPFTDLKSAAESEREALTEQAFLRGDALIYGGRISAGDLLGEPDLLRREGNGYVAGDIKSGAGFEGRNDFDDGEYKDHYAVQLALYTDILERKGIAAGRSPFVWDIHGEEIRYHLDDRRRESQETTLWQLYRKYADRARGILSGKTSTVPAVCGECKQCHWYSACRADLKKRDDLTLISGLGRSKRDGMAKHFGTVAELARADLTAFRDSGETGIRGVRLGTLERFRVRARLLSSPGQGPYTREELHLPDRETELFFDIETDPMGDFCYLHGFEERRKGDSRSERYVYFLAEAPTPEEEERAFGEAIAYIRDSSPCAIYYYSSYEKTFWKKLQRRYPDVAAEDEIIALFDSDDTVDLFTHVVRRHTEWPTNDHSIKTLARYLGFNWRDASPSGAESIEWYHRWIEEGNDAIRQRILEYNEDDCRATRVLLDGIAALPVRSD